MPNSNQGSTTVPRRQTRKWTTIRKVLLFVDLRIYSAFVVPLVAFLPAPIAYGVAIFRSDMRCWLVRPYHQQMKHSLELLFGGKLNDEERDRVVRDYLRNASCQTIDAMRLFGRGESLLRLIEVEGQEHLDAALSSRKGAVLCGAHFGSGTACFSAIGALGYPVTLVARWSYNSGPATRSRKLVFRLQHDYPVTSHLYRPNILHRPGIIGAAVKAAGALRRSQFVGIMIDSPLKRGNLSKPSAFDFLNTRIVLATGAAEIAKLTGAPLIVAILRRSSDWRHLVLEISPPIYVKEDPQEAFARCLKIVESAISRYPAQWRWLPLRRLAQLGMLLPAEMSLMLMKPRRTWDLWENIEYYSNAIAVPSSIS